MIKLSNMKVILSNLGFYPKKEERLNAFRKEINYFKKFKLIDFIGFENLKDELMDEYCDKKYEDRYFYAINEIKAYNKILKIRDTEDVDIPKEFIEKFITRAYERHGDEYFEYQLEYIENEIRSYKNRIKIKLEVEPYRKLLVELESIIGNEAYNGYIQNYESWGILESTGREFRYPVSFVMYDGELKKDKYNFAPHYDGGILMTGHYRFGANDLFIYKALLKVVKHLEKKYGLKIDKYESE